MGKARSESNTFWSDYLYKNCKVEETMKELFRQVSDFGYCEGYNTVLDAIEKVLPKESYWKVVNYLNSIGQ